MPRKTKDAVIKELEARLQLFEDSLMELSKTNKELVDAEENTFIHSPTYIQMQKHIEFLNSQNKLNEIRVANLKRDSLHMEEYARQLYADNQRLTVEKTDREYFVGITEKLHEEKEYQKLRDDICALKGKIEQLMISVNDRDEELNRLRLELALEKQKETSESGTPVIHNARNAGRKKNDETWQKSFNQFVQLAESGCGREEIMNIMGISTATYYRYKNYAKKASLTNS